MKKMRSVIKIGFFGAPGGGEEVGVGGWGGGCMYAVGMYMERINLQHCSCMQERGVMGQLCGIEGLRGGGGRGKGEGERFDDFGGWNDCSYAHMSPT